MAKLNTADLHSYVKGLVDDIITAKKENPMEKQRFSIPNITCAHCVRTIKNELSELEGIIAVEGDPTGKTVTVEWKAPATLQGIEDTLKEINYPAS